MSLLGKFTSVAHDREHSNVLLEVNPKSPGLRGFCLPEGGLTVPSQSGLPVLREMDISLT